MDCLVVGAGEMGRWVGETLAPSGLVLADQDPEVAESTASRCGAEVVPLDGDSTHDVVVVAVPMSAGPSVIAAQADRARQALVDVTGSMTDPLDAMAEQAPDRQRASFHALFAPGNAPGTVASVVAAAGPAIDWVRERLRDAGCDILETTAADHDRAMETVQSGAHAAVLAYALAAEAVPDGMETPVSAGLAELVATVTGNDPAIYAEIQAAFGDGTEAVAEAAGEMASADAAAFRELYAEAGESPVLDHAADGTEDDQP